MTIKDTTKTTKINSILTHRIIFVMIGLIPSTILLYLLFNDIIIADGKAVSIMIPYVFLFLYPMEKIGIVDYYQKTKEEKEQDCFTRKFVIFVHIVVMASFAYFATTNTKIREEQQWNNIIHNHPTLLHRACRCREQQKTKPFIDYKIVTIDDERFIETETDDLRTVRYDLDEIEIYKVIK